MDVFNFSSDVENCAVDIMRARAVLQAASEEVANYIKYQSFRHEHANLLFAAANSLLHDTELKLEKIAEEAIEIHKQSKGGA